MKQACSRIAGAASNRPRHPNPLILDVLRSMPTPREARQFLARQSRIASVVLPGTRDEVPVAVSPPYISGRAGPALAEEPGNKPTQFVRRPANLVLVLLPVEISGAALEAFAGTLGALQALDMSPVVLLDCQRDFESPKGWDRWLAHARQQQLRLTQLVEAAGGRATPLTMGGLAMGANGSITAHLAGALAALRFGSAPLLLPVAYGITGAAQRVSGGAALQALCDATLASAACGDPLRVVLVSADGGLTVENGGPPLLHVSLANDPAVLAARWPEDSAVQRRLGLMQSVLARLPPTASGLIASPFAAAPLVANLIRDKPVVSPSLPPEAIPRDRLDATASATVVRRGIPVARFDGSLAGIDRQRFEELLEAGFGRKLDRDRYWARLERSVASVLVAGDREYEGAVVVTREQLRPGAASLCYLDKFTIHPGAQGSGIADLLWRELSRAFPELFWRSRADNPVNRWYFQRSELSFPVDTPSRRWMAFANGPRRTRLISEYAGICRQIPESFLPVS